ncbi:MAG TPA: hypothetical protein VMN60_09800 [Longimicrobiales bacterium]|nr:hypothetical protein [Longimicrobiales bacterium]
MSSAPYENAATRMDRRGFLRTAAGGSAAVAVASLIPAGCAPAYPERAADGAALQSLTPKEYAVARAAAEALLVGVPAQPDAIATAIDRELVLAGEPMRTDMKTVLTLMEHGTALSFQRKRFTALSPARRRAVLDDWATSRFNLRRAAYGALRGFVVYFAYIDDATRPLTGFPGPWPEYVDIAVTPVDFGDIA